MWDPTDPLVACSLPYAMFKCSTDHGHICEDYEIRVLCDACLLTPLTPSTPATPCTDDFWLPWINRDTPDVGSGDQEQMTPEELSSACAGGQVCIV